MKLKLKADPPGRWFVVRAGVILMVVGLLAFCYRSGQGEGRKALAALTPVVAGMVTVVVAAFHRGKGKR